MSPCRAGVGFWLHHPAINSTPLKWHSKTNAMCLHWCISLLDSHPCTCSFLGLTFCACLLLGQPPYIGPFPTPPSILAPSHNQITRYGRFYIIPLCCTCGSAVPKCWAHCWWQWTWILGTFVDISWCKHLCLVTHIMNNIWDPKSGWEGLLDFNIKVSPWHNHDGEMGFWWRPGGLPSHFEDLKYYSFYV